MFSKFGIDLSQPSTWRGLCMILTGFGVYLNPELVNLIVAAGTSVVGIIGFFFKDKK